MWKKYAICLTSLCEILLGYQIYLRSICLLWTSKDFILLFWELFNPNCRQCKSCLCISVVFKQFDLCFLLNHLNLWVITDYSFSTTKDQYKWFLRVYWKHMEQILGWFCRLHHWKNLQVQFLGMNFATEIFRSSRLFQNLGALSRFTMTWVATYFEGLLIVMSLLFPVFNKALHFEKSFTSSTIL